MWVTETNNDRWPRTSPTIPSSYWTGDIAQVKLQKLLDIWLVPSFCVTFCWVCPKLFILLILYCPNQPIEQNKYLLNDEKVSRKNISLRLLLFLQPNLLELLKPSNHQLDVSFQLCALFWQLFSLNMWRIITFKLRFTHLFVQGCIFLWNKCQSFIKGELYKKAKAHCNAHFGGVRHPGLRKVFGLQITHENYIFTWQ